MVKLVIGHPLLPGHLVPLLLYLLDPHLIEQADEGSDGLERTSPCSGSLERWLRGAPRGSCTHPSLLCVALS